MSAHNELIAGGLVIRPRERVVSVDGHEVDLTFREFEIVMKLVERPGWVFSPEQLSSEEPDLGYSPDSVTVLVSRLRHKLAEAGAGDYIETVRGVGYRIHASHDAMVVAENQGDVTCNALHDALWCLLDTVVELEHGGSEAQRQAAVDALVAARRTIHSARR